MSFRSSTHQARTNGNTSNVSKRGQDSEAGSTAPPKRSTRFRISAAPDLVDNEALAASYSPALAAAPPPPGPPAQGQAQTQIYTQTQSYVHAPPYTRKAPPSSFAQPSPGASSIEQTPSDLQNVGSRSFLQTRRRQPSSNNARLPLGPRPIDLTVSQNRTNTITLNATYNSFTDVPDVSFSGDTSFEPVLNEVNDWTFATVDPNLLPASSHQEVDHTPLSMFSEPAFNFDDFHDNIATTSPSLAHFPLPDPAGSDLLPESISMPQLDQRRLPSHTTIPVPTRTVSGATLTGLTRKTSAASSTNRSYLPKSESMVAVTPNVSSNLRGRRQSHFPPNAFNNITTGPPAKAPRKAVGPGTFVPPEPVESEIKRQPSVAGSKSRDGSNSSIKPKPSIQNARDASKSPKAAKTKSVLLTSRHSAKDLSTPSRTPDPQKSMPQSIHTTPGKHGGTPGRATSPSGSKRMSMATGLGARTISPTDARRMKRMSVMPTAPPVPHRRISQAPPTPQPDPAMLRPRSVVQSPATHNRKSMTTPSSSRTTPDPNRKSYSSGQSLSSSTSYNSTRNSTQVVPRGHSNTSTSRLPTPKPRPDNNEEEVPPVPAIPKSYDSPASEVEQPFFSARSSGLQGPLATPVDVPAILDLASVMSMLDLPDPPSDPPSRSSAMSDQPAYPEQSSADIWADAHPVNRSAYPDPHPNAFSKAVIKNNKRTYPNLRLPPLNLLPLSTPTAFKIDSLKEYKPGDPQSPSTPPGARKMKTPSTPMTASKATFFARPDRAADEHQNAMRSSTSHHTLRREPHTLDNDSPSLPTFSFESSDVSLRGMSPFVSSSVPKDSNEFSNFMRSNFGTELKRTATQQKPNGPRAPSYSIPAKTESSTPTTDQSGSNTPLTAVNTSSQNIQRKRSDTKLLDLSGHDSDAARYDSMPPPKLPASATWSNLSSKISASPTQKPGFFRTRRKTSASSTTTLDRQDSTDSSVTHVVARPSLESVRSSLMMHTNKSGSLLAQVSSLSLKSTLRQDSSDENAVDKDDLLADEEMRKLASKRRDLEVAARKLDSLQARARPVKRISASTALQKVNLNIFERGEIVDYPDVYFTGARHAKKVIGDLSSTATNFGYDDERGDYNIVEGDHLTYRYEVIDLLGKGSFGQVVRCIDHKTGQLVAIKIIRNKKRFHQQALVEVDILQKLRDWDPHKKHHVVSFDQSFYFRSHLCISTDLLDMNLYEFIKIHDFRGFSLRLIRRFTKQMLGSLVLLHQKRVIHCDLKPENILLAHPARADIKVIDFGSSCFENEKVYTYIQSRFYRSPEVILGMSYGMPIDMWSLGCILAELYTGYPIFPGENEQEQLACIMEIFGPPEKHLIEKSTRKKLFFDSMGKPRLTVSSKGKRRRPSSKDLRSVLKCDDEAFLDFITRCLRWDPTRRMNPNDAMGHEFVTGVKMMPATSRRTMVASSSSPMKRGNTIVNNSTRPLPQPPVASSGLRPLTLNSAAMSPLKTSTRRQSAATNSAQAYTTKRASNTTAGPGATRVTVRANGRPDLATAAAAVSLMK